MKAANPQTERLTEWESQALIQWLLLQLNEEQRRELILTLPNVYNKLCGETVAEVKVRVLDPLVR